MARREDDDRIDAVVGHILLDSYRGSTFPARSTSGSHSGSIPIQVPIRSADGDGPLQLCDDTHACVTEIGYAPPTTTPKIIPVSVKIELEDPDNADLPRIDFGTEQGRAEMDHLAAKMAQHISFESNLLLSITVELVVPYDGDEPAPEPVVRRISLGWPTITSLEPWALQLEVGQARTDMQHDPATRSLEWFDVSFIHLDRDAARGVDFYATPRMRLRIEQPGEVFKAEELLCTVETDVPDRLLSGLRVRVADATGSLQSAPAPELVTKIHTDVTVVLDDAFARRVLSPYQHLHFDEITPAEMRISDITTALRDQGFSIPFNQPLAEAGGELRRFIVASRSEGPDELLLWLFVRGVPRKTERQSRRPGVRLRSKIESGELQIFIRGEFIGDSRQLIHEMNELHRTLRDRFERIRDQR